MDEKEIYEICMSVDSFIAAELTESIVRGTSYDILEAHYGILPISRRSFYRRRRTAQRLMRQRMAHLVEEKNLRHLMRILMLQQNYQMDAALKLLQRKTVPPI